MHYPVVQGTSNQIRLQRIGEQPQMTTETTGGHER